VSTCDGFRDALLEAGLDELGGEGSTPLTAHLRGCADCAALARAIQAGHADLAEALEQATSAPIEMGPLIGPRLRPATVATRPRARAALRWLPLAAAAAVAGLLALPGPEPTPAPIRTGSDPVPPTVEAPPGANVVVMPTTDPDITVVWLF